MALKRRDERQQFTSQSRVLDRHLGVAIMVILKSVVGLIIGAILGYLMAVFFGIFNSIFCTQRIGTPDVVALSKSITSFSLAFMPLGAIIGFILPVMDELRRQAVLDTEQRRERETKQRREREAVEAQQQCERDQAAAELERNKNHLSSLVATTRHDYLALPELVAAGDIHLDRAEAEFADRVFAPFWDEIEHATNKLAAYHQGIRRISTNAAAYEQLSSRLSIQTPSFSLPEGKLPDARIVAERLSKIVRAAQKDFQFATIYEQRKTNQLLYVGFGTLGAALSSLGHAISSSLQELSDSVHSSLDDLLQATLDQTEMMESVSERQAEDIEDYREAELHRSSADANARREFERDLLAKEDEQSKMLDNIQRRKKPMP